MKPTLIDIAPIGTSETPGFACGPKGGGFRMLQMPTYPPNPQGQMLRDLRVALHLSLREAAKALEITAVDLSAVERGSKGIETDGWRWCVERLVDCKEQKGD